MLPVSRWLGLVAGALFLRTDAYEEVREARSPFLTGLVLIVVVGVIIALAALVGTALEWAATPNLADIREVIYEGLTRMPWYQESWIAWRWLAGRKARKLSSPSMRSKSM